MLAKLYGAARRFATLQIRAIYPVLITLSRAELAESLRDVGPLLPVYEYRGRIVDGARRAELCQELGLAIRTVRLRSLEVVCRTLWPLHPERAIEEAEASGARSFVDVAALCGVTPGALARVKRPATLAAPKLQPRGEVSRRRLTSVQVLVRMEPQLREYASRGAEKLNVNFTEFVRRAIWAQVARVVPNAPLHRPRNVRALERRAPQCKR